MGLKKSFYFILFFLCFFGGVKCWQYSKAQAMRVDKSKIGWRCNDFVDRLMLYVNFVNFTETLSDKEIFLAYKINICETKECHYQNLTKLQINKNFTLNLILDAYYKYKFQVFSEDSNEPSNLTNDLPFTKFGHCDQYQLNIHSNYTVELNLIKQASSSFVVYIYIGVFVVLCLVVVARFAGFFYSKYQRLP